ncbi:MAG: peptidoglycan DD-metalloendopeptidase family protein [Gammaproteobacteria bacterium]
MHIIVMRRRQGPRRIELGRRHAGAAAFATLVLVVALGAGGYVLGGSGQHRSGSPNDEVAIMRAKLLSESAVLAEMRIQSQAGINAIAARMARLDAQVNQLNALGGQIVKLTGLKKSSFNFNAVPGEGGPAPAREVPWQANNLNTAVTALSSRVWNQERELSALETFLLHEQLSSEVIPRGKPFSGGYVSSPFGWRTDPFTGEREFHEGIDLAGPMGDSVHAIASGIVTWAGPRDGYGKLVVVNDGGGYSTYYAHSEKVLVKVGQIVRRGDPIALLGSTGRSTGPHVHLEVHYKGKPVNPWKYVIGSNPVHG